MPNLVTAYSPGGNRNDFSGSVGVRFTPTVSIPITALGVRLATGNTGSRVISIYNGATTVCSATVTFPTTTVQAQTATAGPSASTGFVTWIPITASASGPVSTLFAVFTSGATGNSKLALYSDSGGPNTLLAQSAVVTNPAAGTVSYTLASNVTVVSGTNYWIGILGDVNLPIGGGSIGFTYISRAYASGFPATGAGFSSNTSTTSSGVGMIIYSGTVGAFYYAAASATLNPGTVYDLVCPETSGGQLWSDVGAVTIPLATGIVAIFGSPGGFSTWTGGNSYVGVDAQYFSPPINALKQPQALPRLIAQYADPVDPDFDAQSLLTLNRRFAAMTNPPAPPPGIQQPTPNWPRELWAAWNEVDPDLDAQHPLTLFRRRTAATIQGQAVLRVSQALLEVVATNPNPPMQVSQLLMEVVFKAPGQQVGAPPRAWRLRQAWPEFEDEPGPRQRLMAPGIADAPITTPPPTPTFFNYAVSVIT